MYRVYCEEGLNLRSKRPKRSRSATHRKPTAGNVCNLHECRSMDFVSGQLYNGALFRALTVADNFSRKYLAIYAGKSLKVSDVNNVMQQVTLSLKCCKTYFCFDN
jgi:putative transposase